MQPYGLCPAFPHAVTAQMTLFFAASPLRRAAVVAGSAALLASGAVFAGSIQQSSADVGADREAAASVRALVAAESKRINATADGIAQAEARLAKLQAREELRRSEFVAAQDKLVLARVRLTRLEHRSDQAKANLGKTLAASYQRGTPDLATILVEANGFSDAVDRVEYEQSVHRQNANQLTATRNARKDATKQETILQGQETKFQSLAKAAAHDRDQANAVRSALLQKQADQLAKQAGKKAQLAKIQTRIRRSEAAQVAAMRQLTDSSSAVAAAPRITGSGQADSVVAKIVAGANQIASTPYVWGGGHGGASGGYDCSGSISYALAAAGLLSSPLTSGGFMSWGLPGPGQRVTIYANGGHVYMYVDGRRYDTSALSSGGTRWTTAARSNAGFVARHPAGL